MWLNCLRTADRCIVARQFENDSEWRGYEKAGFEPTFERSRSLIVWGDSHLRSQPYCSVARGRASKMFPSCFDVYRVENPIKQSKSRAY